MRTWHRAFNIYLLAALAVAGAGCGSTADSKRKEEYCTIKLHLEVNTDSTGRSAPVPIYRAKPVLVNVQTEAFLDERDVTSAAVVVDDLGIAGLSVQFDQHGTLVLNSLTAANKGRRIAVEAQWPEIRWLGAPRITQTVTNGTLVFTPDADPAEVEKIVRGLNRTAAEIRKKSMK